MALVELSDSKNVARPPAPLAVKIVEILLQSGADPCAKDSSGSLPDHCIGADCPQRIESSVARVLSKMVVEHRARNKHHDASSSLECVVNSLRTKVYELEDQLTRAGRHRLELEAHSSDSNLRIFSAAIRPECSICQADAKEAVLDPCRHLATCVTCADSLNTCPFCASPVRGYYLVESREVIGRIYALEEEVVGLRAQLERFGDRVHDLVTANGELILAIHRSKVNTSIFTEEHQVSKESSTLPSPPSSPPRDLAADSDCDSGTGESYITRAYLGMSWGEASRAKNQVALDDLEFVALAKLAETSRDKPRSHANQPSGLQTAVARKAAFPARDHIVHLPRKGHKIRASTPRSNVVRRKNTTGTTDRGSGTCRSLADPASAHRTSRGGGNGNMVDDGNTKELLQAEKSEGNTCSSELRKQVPGMKDRFEGEDRQENLRGTAPTGTSTRYHDNSFPRGDKIKQSNQWPPSSVTLHLNRFPLRESRLQATSRASQGDRKKLESTAPLSVLPGAPTD